MKEERLRIGGVVGAVCACVCVWYILMSFPPRALHQTIVYRDLSAEEPSRYDSTRTKGNFAMVSFDEDGFRLELLGRKLSRRSVLGVVETQRKG